MVRNSASLIQVVSSVALFGLVFQHCWAATMSTQMLLAIDGTLCLGAAVLRLCSFTGGGLVSLRQLQTGAVLLGVLVGLTPILRSLTQAYSDDTILLLSILCIVLHIPSQDYLYMMNYRQRFGGMASLNLAIFATVMLASRLQTNSMVFAFILFSMEIFAAFPMFTHHLKRGDAEGLFHKITSLLFLITAASLVHASKILACVYVITTFFISFVCPLWLKYLQRYKAVIRGGWDEAVPGVPLRRSSSDATLQRSQAAALSIVNPVAVGKPAVPLQRSSSAPEVH